MPGLRVGDVLFDAGLVVFDKDGTLLDFEFMWGTLLRSLVAALTADVSDSEASAANAPAPGALARALYNDVGYDPRAGRTLPQSPWSMATTDQVLTILAATLYRHGRPWPAAEAVVRAEWARLSAAAAMARLVRPTGDLVALFTGLQAAGIRTAVDTTDDRRATEQALRLLGIAALVDSIACGDDALPPKPAPDRLLATYRKLGVPAAHTVMVGDTAFDLVMGRQAGVGLTDGVLTGAGDRATLAPHADVILDSLNEIKIVK